MTQLFRFCTVFYPFFLKIAQMRIDFTEIDVHNRTYRAVGVHKRTFYTVAEMPANKGLERKTYAAPTNAGELFAACFYGIVKLLHRYTFYMFKKMLSINELR